MTRLYRFYNMEASKHGEPFALCDSCKEEQQVPSNCILEKIADEAVAPCMRCDE